MHTIPKDSLILFVYLFSVISFLLYVYGFFPIESTFDVPDVPENNIPRYGDHKTKENRVYVQKLAIILIDGLRFDFVMLDNGEVYMPFVLSSIRKNESCLMKLKAHAPTVTMPRIKAITSGTVPTFIDVFLNIKASSSEYDSFIRQASLRNRKLVFYGDDTWLKLFPNTFIRSEGTNSFFASDFTEVDNNVTRHLEEEFRKNDWDILILHYLGLDHIGHMEGPTSPFVKPKLEEMDAIVYRFSEYFKKLETETGIQTMLIVTGDHGMKDSGSHGGVTYSEVMVPLVHVGKPCLQLPGWIYDHIPPQIDIAPTLSLLLGFPTPYNSIGKLIPQLLNGMEIKDVLRSLELNKMHLLQRTSIRERYNTTQTLLENWLKNEKSPVLAEELSATYFKELSELSETFIESKSKFKMAFLITSCIFLWLSSFIMLVLAMQIFVAPSEAIHWFLIIGSILHAISCASTSFIEEEHQIWYFLWMTFSTLASANVLQNHSLSTPRKLITSFPWIVLCFVHRALRKLNQTGDKWAHLPDIAHFINSADNRTWLLVFFITSLVTLFYCSYKGGCRKFQLATYGVALVVIICYRLAVSSIHLGLINYPLSHGSLEVKIFWGLVAVFTVQTIRNKTDGYLVWSLIAALLFRPHNVILVPMEIFYSRQIKTLFTKADEVVWNNLAHVWIGHTFYFYQGNGNSLADIDIASGFVGLEEYQPVYVAFLLLAHTCSGPIFSYLLSPKSISVFALLRIVPLTIYCTLLIFQLNHLFIWLGKK